MKSNRKTVSVVLRLLACGLFCSLFFFEGTITQACAEEVILPSFGTGKTQVRLYTDYFCGPCSRMEPRVEALLADLVKRDTITLTFVDVPLHGASTLYAKYFLYTLDKGNVSVGIARSLRDKKFRETLRARAVLFEAAKNKIDDSEKLEEYLKKRDVKFTRTDPRPAFVALSALINEDNIGSTPTCVIIKDGKKGTYTGESEIGKALELMK